jgi:hypothetical protein
MSLVKGLMEVSSKKMCSVSPQGQTTQKEEIMRILTWKYQGQTIKEDFFNMIY